MTAVQHIDDGGDALMAVDVGGGVILPSVSPTAKEAKRIFDNEQKYEFSQNDVMLCTYPKSGKKLT